MAYSQFKKDYNVCVQMGGTRGHHHAAALYGDPEPLNSAYTDWSHEEGRHKDNSEERGSWKGGKEILG